MISSEQLQSSVAGYSMSTDGGALWAPYVMNGLNHRPDGAVLSIPEGGKASPKRFKEIASFAISSLTDQGIEPTPDAVRLALVDGSLSAMNGEDVNYRAGVDCSGFAYFALKGCGVAIDQAIIIPSHVVLSTADRLGRDRHELTELVQKADDRALSVTEFLGAFYKTAQPHKSVNTARFDESSSPIQPDDAQPGDIAIYRRKEEAVPNHIALVQAIDSQGDIKLIHSGRESWDSDPGGVAAFTISRKEIADFYDEARGSITLKRIDGLK